MLRAPDNRTAGSEWGARQKKSLHLGDRIKDVKKFVDSATTKMVLVHVAVNNYGVGPEWSACPH
jgi:hypothetical protein